MLRWLTRRKPTDAEREKQASEERMKLFDSLPTKWREHANEHGLNKTLQAMERHGE